MNSGANIRFLNSLSYRVWKAGGVCTHILEGHCGAVSSINIIKSDGMNKRLPSLKCLLFASVANFFTPETIPSKFFPLVSPNHMLLASCIIYFESRKGHICNGCPCLTVFIIMKAVTLFLSF